MTADLFFALHLLVQIVLIGRALLRPHREPAARIAWIVVIAVLPVAGILAYVLVGETSIGRRQWVTPLTAQPPNTRASGIS